MVRLQHIFSPAQLFPGASQPWNWLQQWVEMSTWQKRYTGSEEYISIRVAENSILRKEINWNFLSKTGWRFSRQSISKFPQSQVFLGHLCLRAAILEWCLSWWECTQGCPVRGRQKSEALVLCYTSLLQDFFYTVFNGWFSLETVF